MGDIAITFRIAVNTDKEKILNILKRYREHLRISFDENTVRICKNNVAISHNEDYDEKLSIKDEDRYLYYKTNMDFYPQGDNIELEKQIETAKNMVKIFADYGIASEIIAEFENLM